MPNYGTNSTVHAAHVDVATMQGALVSGYLANNSGNSKLVFVKKTVKTNIFSLAPQAHVNQGGSSEFGKKTYWKIGRQGDYLLNNWIRAEISSVKASEELRAKQGTFLRWTHNLGHNLFNDIELSFSTVPAANFDEFYLDFFSAFSVPAGKRNLYDNMIGNLPELVNPIHQLDAGRSHQVLPAAVLNIPLPLPYTRDLGIALPTGGLIYNEVTLSVDVRPWTELMVVSNGFDTTLDGVPAGYSRQVSRADVDAPPTVNLQLWGTYAIVTSDERKLMGRVPRDMIWEVIQTASHVSVQTPTQTVLGYLRYTYAVKCLFFGMRNDTVRGQLSNYTTRQALCYNMKASGPITQVGLAAVTANGDLHVSTTEFPAPNAFDPISGAIIRYEGADRVSMNTDYYSMVQPYYHAHVAPNVTGYHVFSYSVDFVNTAHGGSTDYGKLTNVSMEVGLSDDALAALKGAPIPDSERPFVNERGALSALPPGYVGMASVEGRARHLNGNASGSAGVVEGTVGPYINQPGGFNSQKQTFELKNACLAHNVVRVIGGGVGFPIF